MHCNMVKALIISAKPGGRGIGGTFLHVHFVGLVLYVLHQRVVFGLLWSDRKLGIEFDLLV